MRWIDTMIRDLIRRPACTGCGPSSNYDTRRVPTTTRTVWASDSDSRRVPTTTRIQSEVQDRATGGFSNGRVPYTGLDTTA